MRRGGVHLRCGPQIFDAVVYLIRHCDRVVSRDELRRYLWPDPHTAEGALSNCLQRARELVRGEAEIRAFLKRGFQFIRLADAAAVDTPPPIIGRQAECARLFRQVDALSRGEGSMTLLTGERASARRAWRTRSVSMRAPTRSQC